MTPTGQLVLARLLAKKGQDTPAELRKALDPFFERRLRAGESRELLETTLAHLTASGLITRKPLALTEAGRGEAMATLGLTSVPNRCDWRTIKNRYLVAKALGLSVDEAKTRLADKDDLRAQILKHHYHIEGEAKTLAQVLDALVARQLGLQLRAGETLTINVIRAQALNRLIKEGSSLSLADLQAQLPTKAINALSSHPDRLRESLLARWLSEGTADSTDGHAPQPSAEPQFAAELDSFARRVQEAADASPTGRFGDNKVFISHVWRNLERAGAFPGMHLAEFKQYLVQAHQAGLLQMSRADLVQVMDPHDVRESETAYLNALFHFIQIAR